MFTGTAYHNMCFNIHPMSSILMRIMLGESGKTQGGKRRRSRASFMTQLTTIFLETGGIFRNPIKRENMITGTLGKSQLLILLWGHKPPGMAGGAHGHKGRQCSPGATVSWSSPARKGWGRRPRNGGGECGQWRRWLLQHGLVCERASRKPNLKLST